MHYHFLKAEYAIQALRDERIKVSRIKELNDPFELLPYLRFDKLEERKRYYSVWRSIGNKYGLLCFSRNWEEPLLWGHYANKHQGIALGFELLKDEVLKVGYSDQRPRLKLTGIREKDEKEFLKNLAGTKHKTWSYEDESRILVKLDECLPDGGNSFLSFGDRLVVKEIVLGARIDKGQLIVVRDLANKLGTKVVVARLSFGEYKILKDGGKTAKFNK